MVYRAQGLRNLGLAQTIIGILMVILGIASIAALHHWSSYVACGLWVGVWVGLTGVFAYLGARSNTSPNNCLIGTMVGFAVTACVITGTMVIIYAIALAQFSHVLRCRSIDYRKHDYYYNNNCRYNFSHNYLSYSAAQTGAAIGSLLLILSVFEFFIALASSIYGCNSCCCSTPTVQATQQIAYMHSHGAGNVIVINPHGAVAPYPGQPMQVIQPGGQQGYYVQQQQYPMQQQQAFATNPGFAGAAGGGNAPNYPQQTKAEDLPPPYSGAQ